MATVTMERSVEEIVAGWRDGGLEDGPAGPLYSHDYAVQEITATGTGGCGLVTSTSLTMVSAHGDPCSKEAKACC